MRISEFKRVFANATSHRASGMMILQIRPMMLELVQRVVNSALQPRSDSTARFKGSFAVVRT
jgi:hypothetical protein